MTFRERVQEVSQRQQSRLVIGLDTDRERIPEFLLGEKNPLVAFNRLVIEATRDLVIGYKPNFAFYEAEGAVGWEALEQTVDCIPGTLLSIADAKRGDISHTAAAYARAVFDTMNFNAVTLNPYMGRDVITPFEEYPGKGLILLALTSNPGAADFQMTDFNDTPLFERVIDRINAWNLSGDLAAVTGATHPEQLERIRHLAPDLPLLIPGIGAQGGDLRRTLAAVLPTPQSPVMINVSRGIIYAGSGQNFQDQVRQKAREYRDNINGIIAELHAG